MKRLLAVFLSFFLIVQTVPADAAGAFLPPAVTAVRSAPAFEEQALTGAIAFGALVPLVYSAIHARHELWNLVPLMVAAAFSWDSKPNPQPREIYPYPILGEHTRESTLLINSGLNRFEQPFSAVADFLNFLDDNPDLVPFSDVDAIVVLADHRNPELLEIIQSQRIPEFTLPLENLTPNVFSGTVGHDHHVIYIPLARILELTTWTPEDKEYAARVKKLINTGHRQVKARLLTAFYKEYASKTMISIRGVTAIPIAVLSSALIGAAMWAWRVWQHVPGTPVIIWAIPIAAGAGVALVLFLAGAWQYWRVMEAQRNWQDTNDNRKAWAEGVQALRETAKTPDAITIEPRILKPFPTRREIIRDLFTGHAPPVANYIPAKKEIPRGHYSLPSGQSAVPARYQLMPALVQSKGFALQALHHEEGEHLGLGEGGATWRERKAGLSALPRLLTNGLYYLPTILNRDWTPAVDPHPNKLATTTFRRELDNAVLEYLRQPTSSRLQTATKRLLALMENKGTATTKDQIATWRVEREKAGSFANRYVEWVSGGEDASSVWVPEGTFSPSRVRRARPDVVPAKKSRTEIRVETDPAAWLRSLRATIGDLREDLLNALDQNDSARIQPLVADLLELWDTYLEAKKPAPSASIKVPKPEPASLTPDQRAALVDGFLRNAPDVNTILTYGLAPYFDVFPSASPELKKTAHDIRPAMKALVQRINGLTSIALKAKQTRKYAAASAVVQRQLSNGIADFNPQMHTLLATLETLHTNKPFEWPAARPDLSWYDFLLTIKTLRLMTHPEPDPVTEDLAAWLTLFTRKIYVRGEQRPHVTLVVTQPEEPLPPVTFDQTALYALLRTVIGLVAESGSNPRKEIPLTIQQTKKGIAITGKFAKYRVPSESWKTEEAWMKNQAARLGELKWTETKRLTEGKGVVGFTLTLRPPAPAPAPTPMAHPEESAPPSGTTIHSWALLLAGTGAIAAVSGAAAHYLSPVYLLFLPLAAILGIPYFDLGDFFPHDRTRRAAELHVTWNGSIVVYNPTALKDTDQTEAEQMDAVAFLNYLKTQPAIVELLNKAAEGRSLDVVAIMAGSGFEAPSYNVDHDRDIKTLFLPLTSVRGVIRKPDDKRADAALELLTTGMDKGVQYWKSQRTSGIWPIATPLYRWLARNVHPWVGYVLAPVVIEGGLVLGSVYANVFSLQGAMTVWLLLHLPFGNGLKRGPVTIFGLTLLGSMLTSSITIPVLGVHLAVNWLAHQRSMPVNMPRFLAAA